MEKEFIPYKQALALKELGFDEECFISYYDKKGLTAFGPRTMFVKNSKTVKVCAPTFSQAFRWFREKHNLVSYIQYYSEWNFEIFRIDNKIAELQDDIDIDYTFRGGTYEEAELECLKKLIEIVKTKETC